MKTEFKSYIFEVDEDKKVAEKQWTIISWIIVLLFILFLVLEWIGLAFVTISVLFIAKIVIAINRWGEAEPLNGSLPAPLTINEKEIRIGDDSYPIHELNIRRLTCTDYLGQSIYAHSFLQYPMRSNGTGNYLWFRHKGKDFKLRFRIESEGQKEILEKLKKNFRIKW